MRTKVFSVCFLLTLGVVSLVAQGRPGFFSTVQLSDTSANALLVGCNLGSTTCTGGIKAGTIVATLTGTATSFTGSLTGDVTSTAMATSVVKINGVLLSGLGTGILKNTTGTGVPSIAIAADFPTLNQNTSGYAAGLAVTSQVAGDLYVATSINTTGRLAPGSAGQVLASNGAGLAPSWVSASAPGAHVLVSATHTASGLTTGHFLKATGASSFAFAAHGLTYSDVSAAPAAGNSSIVTVGALASGSIASGFTAIADARLDTISTAGKVSNSATTATATNNAATIVLRDGSGDLPVRNMIPSLSTMTMDFTGGNSWVFGADALYKNGTNKVLGAASGGEWGHIYIDPPAGGNYMLTWDSSAKEVKYAAITSGSLSSNSCPGGERVNSWTADGNGFVSAFGCGAVAPTTSELALAAKVVSLEQRLADLEQQIHNLTQRSPR